MFTISDTRMPGESRGTGKVGYFVNDTLVKTGDPNDPRVTTALKNFGVFVVSETEGTATYLQDGKAYVRTLKANSGATDPTGNYLVYTEDGMVALESLAVARNPATGRQWGFEKQQGPGGWQIAYKDAGTNWIFFQIATKVSISA